jgi:putative flippase GtrA
MRLHHRIALGTTRPANWHQLGKYLGVGAAGYLVNVGAFWVLFRLAGFPIAVAAVGAFLAGVSHNFVLNRHWTFAATHDRRRFQAPRFFAVSLTQFVLALGLLHALADGAGVDEVAAQALSIAWVFPVGFVGNKLYSFRRPAMREGARRHARVTAR